MWVLGVVRAWVLVVAAWLVVVWVDLRGFIWVTAGQVEAIGTKGLDRYSSSAHTGSKPRNDIGVWCWCGLVQAGWCW